MLDNLEAVNKTKADETYLDLSGKGLLDYLEAVKKLKLMKLAGNCQVKPKLVRWTPL